MLKKDSFPTLEGYVVGISTLGLAILWESAKFGGLTSFKVLYIISFIFMFLSSFWMWGWSNRENYPSLLVYFIGQSSIALIANRLASNYLESLFYLRFYTVSFLIISLILLFLLVSKEFKNNHYSLEVLFSNYLKRTWALFFNTLNSPLIRLSIIIIIPLGYLIHFRYLFLLENNSSSPWVDLLVEAHGLIFDILFFSIFLGLYTSLLERRNRIKRYQDEIDDYRGWDEKEAMYRIVGSVKRLIRENSSSIDLSYCFLENANLSGLKLENVNLYRANLKNADLRWSDLTNANIDYVNFTNAKLASSDLTSTNFRSHTTFSEAWMSGIKLNDCDLPRIDFKRFDLIGAEFIESNLSNSNFSGANLKEVLFINTNLENANLENTYLVGADFTGANVMGVNLDGAKVASIDWIDQLENSNVKNIEWIRDNYSVDDTLIETYYNGSKVTCFIIHEKSE